MIELPKYTVPTYNPRGLAAAAKDLLDQEHAVSVADKIKELLK